MANRSTNTKTKHPRPRGSQVDVSNFDGGGASSTGGTVSPERVEVQPADYLEAIRAVQSAIELVTLLQAIDGVLRAGYASPSVEQDLQRYSQLRELKLAELNLRIEDWRRRQRHREVGQAAARPCHPESIPGSPSSCCSPGLAARCPAVYAVDERFARVFVSYSDREAAEMGKAVAELIDAHAENVDLSRFGIRTNWAASEYRRNRVTRAWASLKARFAEWKAVRGG
jgi:hypothetical protein